VSDGEILAAAGEGRVAIFGGTFDPVHVGHLILAERVRDTLSIERLFFVPCGRPPHKESGDISPGAERLAMLELAVADHPGFAVSDIELAQAGASYTIHTVRRMREAGAREVVLVIGADSLADLPGWYEPEALLTESRIVVVARPEVDLEQVPRPTRERVRFVDCPLIEVSSTDIRARVHAGRSIRYLVPEPVREYIARQRLYG
jgi:nicotinate-nucleotide adenylyltransferase